tara:strand:- start:847 stop:1083 length:237 start_codon:yes stop_codon:yes gene_type:complete
MDKNMSMKFNNVIPFPKQNVKLETSLEEMYDMVLQKQKELDELDDKMADILDRAIQIEKESQRLLDLAEQLKNGNEDL